MHRLASLAQTLNQNPIAAESDVFAHITMAPPDPILGTAVAYRADPDPTKINLGIGAYRDDAGSPYVFNVVRKVEQEILNDTKLDKEYLPIDGLVAFNTGAQKLIFGENSPVIKENRVATVQAISGTGSLRVGFEFLGQYMNRTVLISRPTWLNHQNIVTRSGLKWVEYPYFSKEGVDIKGMLEAL